MSGGGDDHDARIKSLEDDRVRQWEEISKLQRFQAWVTGIAVGAAAALGLFVDYIKKHLGLG